MPHLFVVPFLFYEIRNFAGAPLTFQQLCPKITALSDEEKVSMVVFGSYQLDTTSGDLRKFGYRIKLQPLPKRILLSLVVEPGKAVRRDILYHRLWPNGLSTDVEHGLNTAVKKLRAVLNDNAEQPRYIETVAGVGYRFIATVEVRNLGRASSE